MAAGIISIYQDADQTIGLHFTDADGDDIDITGKTAYLYVAQGIDADNLLTKSQTSHTDPTHGQTTISLTATETNLTVRGYSYEIWLDNTPSDKGQFIVKDTLRGGL